MRRPTARKLLFARLELPVAKMSARLGLTPNQVTLLGLLIAGISAYLLGIGQLAAGGVVLLFSGAFDLFDGAIARATDRVTAFGAFLDSTTDRMSEIMVLLGLLVYYLNYSLPAFSTSGAILVYIVLAGSIMVSYIRARAEGLGVECTVGIMTRPERVTVLGIALIAGHWWNPAVQVILGIIAVLTFLTIGQRMLHTWRRLTQQ